MSTEKLDRLVADNNPVEAITLFIRNTKIRLDFEYRESVGVEGYDGGFKMCSLCRRDVRAHDMDDHLRLHNKQNDTH